MPAIKTSETDLIKDIISLGKPVNAVLNNEISKCEEHASRGIKKKHGILANHEY